MMAALVYFASLTGLAGGFVAMRLAIHRHFHPGAPR